MKIISQDDARSAGLELFYTGRPCKRGHLARRRVIGGDCVPCSLLRSEQRRTREPAATRAASKRWREQNREEVRRYNKEYYAATRESQAEQKRLKRLANLETARAKDRADRIGNAATQHTRSAKKRAAPGSYSATDLATIRKLQRDKCAMPFCRKLLKGKGHVDHIVPLSKGGTNWPSNLQLLCQACNQKKATRDPLEHARSLGLLL